MTKKIFIAGSGGIGEAAGLLLREWAGFQIELFIGDISETSLSNAKDFITHNSPIKTAVNTVSMTREGINDAMKAAFTGCDVLLDCSPGGQAPRMARFAKEFNMHYANLTEYVAETEEIMDLAKDAETGFVLQTGLAPGFINVLAMSLYKQFVEQYKNDAAIQYIGMKVGALTAHAHEPHFYGFTWSPIGVATEYVKDSRVIRNGEIVLRPALSDRETIVIGGRTFEADLTSGGAADLPDYFDSRGVNRLDYKTLRYAGHYGWVDSILDGIPKDLDIPAELELIMLREIPSVEDDLVVVQASVDGFDENGRRRMLEKAYFVEPLAINGHKLRAIQTTTAAPLCESAMMLLTGDYKGVVLQSQLKPTEFLSGNFVSRVYKD